MDCLFVKVMVLMLVAYYEEVTAYLKEPCRDIAAESTCWLLLRRGLCQNDAAKMKIYCSKTCGFCHSCEDYLLKEKCKELTSYGACLHNHQKMKNLCPETCGFCPKNCKDKYPRCKKLRDHRACLSHADRMKEICPESCGHCKPRTACDNYFCPIGFNCHLKKDGTAYCLCNADCSRTARSGPICAKNGKDYPHLCALKKDECATLSFIPVSHYGLCNKPTSICADESRESKAGLCKQWKTIGACTRHVSLMKTYCRKTCDLCRVPRNPPKPKCLDSEFGCCWNGKDVAKKGKYGEGCAPCVDLRFCELFQLFCGSKISQAVMKKFCPLTCGYCVPQTKHKIFERDRKRELARRKQENKT